VARVSAERLAAVRQREAALMAARTPRSSEWLQRARRSMPNGVPMAWMSGLYRFAPPFATHGEGAAFFDADGNRYLDFNLCDLSVTMGFNHPAVVEAVSNRTARGAHFLLPTEDAMVAAELLAERVTLPFWQFTLSASGANSEVIRAARQFTGRERIVVFEGHYHGHLEETLVTMEDGRCVPALKGVSRDAVRHTTVIPFNDLGALEQVLVARDVALVLTEPALTNCNVVLPEAGYLAAMRELTHRYGSLLCFDEAHTFQFAYGGLARTFGVGSDFVVLGKGLGTGISFGLYGMSEEMGSFFEKHADIDIGPAGLATGGTMYATAVAAAAARVALEKVLAPRAYAEVGALGQALADGLERLFKKYALPWGAFRCGPRSGYCLAAELPRNGAEAKISLDANFIDARRLFLANRGVWDAVASAGPQISFAHTLNDVSRYLEAADSFLGEIVE
jgi:glutamate-1-semialdehyde 2,1-aminomutase